MIYFILFGVYMLLIGISIFVDFEDNEYCSIVNKVII